MTKETISTGSKSANKPTDLKQFNKTTQHIVKKSKTKKPTCRSESQFANKSQQKKIPFMAVYLEQDTRWASVKRQKQNMTVRLDSQYLGVYVSRAAPPTQLRPEILLFLTLNLQEETSYSTSVSQEDPRSLPPYEQPMAADPGGHRQVVRGNSSCRAALVSHSLKVSNKNLIQQSSYCIVNPLSTRCVSW